MGSGKKLPEPTPSSTSYQLVAAKRQPGGPSQGLFFLCVWEAAGAGYYSGVKNLYESLYEKKKINEKTLRGKNPPDAPRNWHEGYC